MFETLDDQIKRDTELESSRAERFLRWAAAIVVTLLVLGGLYYGVKMLE